ncbi:MAG: FAD synthetase [archaeon GW2011_AR9]|nr:MAG: FAD synthetase [archaeon GW2011_AR9]MBS3120367.1 FAD synthase [Candidatus Woesearchaeota archaeon]OFY85332.1 MAG: hypothetical protein A2236_06805 [Bacteroidetes bacterium RIFOXYA2_FULL_33_7]HIG92859.1 FAD synthase [Candidatus Woesearchaeota archaeon]HIH13166.1 FAD synthase [Candidatus Woesearchaeota archaeon]
MKKVMCFGTFDLLHLGHLNYFQQAKKYGNYLIVVIARDQTKKDQHKETIFTEQERLELVRNLKMVDEAVLGYHENHFRIIQEKKPDVICLGYDQKMDEAQLEKKLAFLGLCPSIKRLKPYNTNKNKSAYLKSLVLERD